MGLLEYQWQTLDLSPLMRQDLKVQSVSPQHQAATKSLFSILAFQLLSATFIRVCIYICAAELWESSHADLGGTPSLVSSFHVLTHPNQFLAALISDFCFLLELYLLCMEQTGKCQLNVYLIQCASFLESIKAGLMSACFWLIYRDIDIFVCPDFIIVFGKSLSSI